MPDEEIEPVNPDQLGFQDPADRLTRDESDDLVEAEASTPTVNYSGQDFDVAGLVRRLNEEGILVPIFGHRDERIQAAGFQRSFVWRKPQMDRFIESLLLGFPIPGIFLVRQADRRYLVLDGQQRLRTLQFFVNGLFNEREFKLENVSPSFKNLTYKTLSEEQKRLFDDTFIQATIVATDGSRESLESIYQIFERLNAGGTQLTPHEIRVALYAGPCIDFLEELNQVEAWRKLYGSPSPRLRDQELVLRIVALLLAEEKYKRPLKSFLNDFVSERRELQGVDSASIKRVFEAATGLLERSVGRDALRWRGGQVNMALTEAVVVGLMRRLESDGNFTEEQTRSAVAAIQAHDGLADAISKATADDENVKTRLGVATAAFAEA